jgi:hypothetical protein
MGTRSFLRVEGWGWEEWLRCGVYHPLPSSAKVKERVELYFYSPLWVFKVCYRVNFTMLYQIQQQNL